VIKLFRFLTLFVLFLALIPFPEGTVLVDRPESPASKSVQTSGVHPAAQPYVQVALTPKQVKPIHPITRANSYQLDEPGGDDTGETTTFDWNILAALLLTLAAMVPTLGGTVGGIVGLLVDVIKAILLVNKKQLPDNWGGYLAIILNAVFWVGLFILLKQAPASMLPDHVEQWFKIAATALTFLLTFLTQLHSSGLAHQILVSKAPNIFSVSERKRREELVKRGIDPTLIVG
jgi:hypothetical protein